MTRRQDKRAKAASSERLLSRPLPVLANASARLAVGFMLILSATVIAVGAPAATALAQSTDVTELLRRAESGDARAAFILGMRYAKPDDSSRDDAEAVRWLRQAAEQGLAEAQYNLGIMYAGGRGVARDGGLAADWYRQAAEQGLAGAQYNLGAQYAVGDGVPRDEQQAATWFERAALQNVPEAAYNLGVLYDLGRGVNADAATAMHWYERAAARGYHPAASRLAALRAANPSLASKPSASSSTAGAGEQPTKSAGVVPAELPSGPSAGLSAASSAPSSAGPAGGGRASNAGQRSASLWLARLDPDHYTLQVLSHTDEASVRRYLEGNFNDGEAGYFAFDLDGKTWYTVVTGDYASYSRATAAVQSLAVRLQGSQPWVRKIAIIQKAAIR
jgi:TPR repeat protein